MNVVTPTATKGLSEALLAYSSTRPFSPEGKAISRWLERNEVKEDAFHVLCERAQDLAHPNQSGWAALRRIESADQSIFQRIREFPIQLAQGTSLDRLLGSDPKLAYLVTTVTVLARYHEPDHISMILTSVMTNDSKMDGEATRRWYWWLPFATTVVSKIVDDVIRNVCNTNRADNISGLPEGLAKLPKQVYLLPDQFASVIGAIHSSEGDVIVQSKHFFPDLALWLLYHFDGVVKVVVDNKVMTLNPHSTSKRLVTLIIGSWSDMKVADTDPDRKDTIRVSVAINPLSSQYQTVFRSSSQPIKHSVSSLRQQFYDIEHFILGPSKTGPGTLLSVDVNIVRSVASRILHWILGLRVSLHEESRLLRFLVSFNDESEADGWHVLRDLFHGVPRLLHACKRTDVRDLPVFGSRFATDAHGEKIQSEEWATTAFEQPSVTRLLTWFPEVEKIMQDLQKKCPGDECRLREPLDKCKEGCLREEAASRLLLLLAHGLSDAMGGRDVSGNNHMSEQKDAMMKVLNDLIYYETIDWDTVFSMVASVTAGVDMNNVFYDGGDESSSWVAVQNGPFVVLARWLDLKKPRQLNQVFALDILDGVTMIDVRRDVAALRSEGATTNVNHDLPRETELPPTSTTAIMDLVQTPDSIRLGELRTVVFHMSGHSYRLWTLVEAGKYMRHVDVTLSLLGYLSSLRSIPECKHAESVECAETDGRQIIVTDFDRALGTWGFASPRGVIQVTKILDEALKLNSILSASPESCVIREIGRCCFNCALQYLLDNDFRVSDSDGECLRIINVDVTEVHKLRLKRRDFKEHGAKQRGKLALPQS